MGIEEYLPPVLVINLVKASLLLIHMNTEAQMGIEKGLPPRRADSNCYLREKDSQEELYHYHESFKKSRKETYLPPFTPAKLQSPRKD
ncbi:hypothetical protein ACLOJK_033433 [Asimina triloba]